MDPILQEIQEYLIPGGRNPFREWMHSLRDIKARAQIRVRLNRVRLGNFDNCKALGDGVHELRIDFGPGYRVYFGRASRTIVLLLCGRTKSSQDRDIAQAKAYWTNFERRSA